MKGAAVKGAAVNEESGAASTAGEASDIDQRDAATLTADEYMRDLTLST